MFVAQEARGSLQGIVRLLQSSTVHIVSVSGSSHCLARSIHKEMQGAEHGSAETSGSSQATQQLSRTDERTDECCSAVRFR